MMSPKITARSLFPGPAGKVVVEETAQIAGLGELGAELGLGAVDAGGAVDCVGEGDGLGDGEGEGLGEGDGGGNVTV